MGKTRPLGKTRPPQPFVPPKLLEGESEPAWAVATLFPPQGCWSEQEYLALPTNRLVEFSDGVVEVLPVPTRLHQEIVAFLYEALKAVVLAGKLGKVYFAALPVHLRPEKYREPDVIFVRHDNAKALKGEYLEGADLVMEVVSRDDPDRDWVKKRRDYAEAGIPEYWVVDPHKKIIVVFVLKGDEYAIHGEFASAQQRATSKLLPGLSVSVDEALTSGPVDS